MNFRRLKMGLSTLFGGRQNGFFIPYRYANSIRPLSRQLNYPALEDIMALQENQFRNCLMQIDKYSEKLLTLNNTSPPKPRWQQDWFPRLDGAMAYTMVREMKPARIIEIGSGHSTRFMMQAIGDGELSTEFHSIDPAPRADIAKLPLTLSLDTVQKVDPGIFESLKAGDFLFIDSSHIAMPGTDVDLLFLNILPKLPAGVIIHIHDIFLPDGYPAEWEWREYNEQQIVAPLLFSGAFKLLFASHYVTSRMNKDLAAAFINSLPLQEGAKETSLWLRKD